MLTVEGMARAKVYPKAYWEAGQREIIAHEAKLRTWNPNQSQGSYSLKELVARAYLEVISKHPWQTHTRREVSALHPEALRMADVVKDCLGRAEKQKVTETAPNPSQEDLARECLGEERFKAFYREPVKVAVAQNA